MRIAVFHELPAKSGSFRAVNQIAKVLKKNNSIDLYYTGKEREKSQQKNFNKVYFYYFKPTFWTGNNWKARLKRDTIDLFKLYFLHKKIAYIIDLQKYDIAFIHASYLTESPFILRFLKTKTIYYAHASNYSFVALKVIHSFSNALIKQLYEKLNRKVREYVDRVNVRSANSILANSRFTQRKIKQIYNRSSLVAYLGVDTNIYKHEKISKKYDVLFIGSSHPVDGYPLLQEARTYLSSQVKIKELLIEKEWISSDERLVELYNKSRIVVCLAHEEPFGMVAIEAMACGIPVIAVNEGGYKEVVQHGKSGYIIARNPKALANNIQKLIAYKKIYNSFSKTSLKKISSFWNLKMRVAELESILKKA